LTGFFTVIDFEGTSRATEIGMVTLNEKLEQVDFYESVIKPPVQPKKWSLSISRLSKHQLATAPTFTEIWPSIHPYLSGRVLVAHNKIYEQGVIRRELSDVGCALEMTAIVCTLEWSRKLLKHKLNNHTLADVAAYFDVELTNSHEALADATATAFVFKKLYEMSNDLRAHCNELLGKTLEIPSPKGIARPSQIRQRYTTGEMSQEELNEIAREIYSNSKIKIVVMTGKLLGSQRTMEQRIADAGYMFKESPTTAGTAFVIHGHSGGLSKIEKAEKYDRPILTEEDAIKVLDLLMSYRMER
jgi:DNA polymerase-3 subunit epsilon